MANEYFINSNKDLNLIRAEWQNLIAGRKVNKELIPPIVYESWKRSYNLNVNPYNLSVSMKDEDIFKEIEKYPELVSKYGEIVELIKNLAYDRNWVIQIFDKNAKSLFNISDRFQTNIKKLIAYDASEKAIGTNAIALSIKEKRPIQLLGPEHYNMRLHDVNCSSAPIFNHNGELIAIINISSIDERHNIVTLSLVTTIAKVLSNNIIISQMIKDLSSYNTTLKEIVKYLPQGILYISKNNKIINYNNKLLEILKIKKYNDENIILDTLSLTLNKMGILNNCEKSFEKKEVIVELNNSKKSLLISVKIINNTEQFDKNKLILIEDTDEVMKQHTAIRKKNVLYCFDDIIGENKQIKEVKEIARKIAKSSSSILIFGENGTGKELFAQAIHNESTRRDKTFIPINCGAIPSELIESELFGYESGSFTGAFKGGRAGKLEIASGGTLFLDEVDSMPLNVQIKLLRALSSGFISRIGSFKEIPIDIRIISATKKDLLIESKYGNFREDLYFRLNTFILKIPSLRKRKDDIPILVNHFINYYMSKFNLQNVKISNEYIKALITYEWQGNVRELRNVVERSMVLLEYKEELTIELLPENITSYYNFKFIKGIIEVKSDDTTISLESNSRGLLLRFEEVLINTVLNEENYNVSRTSERLGISRPTLYRKLKQYNLDKSVINFNDSKECKIL